VESDSLLFDWGMAENKSSPLFEAVVLCSGSSLELLLSSVMFTDLLGSDVLGTEGLLVPVLKDCLKFVILPMRVFGT
jgi:hypothetical protein